MSRDPFANALILTGPTGSGKSQLALAVAERLGAEIVSMDSMALYRGMDIGTAKPTRAERRRVPHHLIDVLDPWQSASVAWWLDEAAARCEDIETRGRRPLLVGGTPLYLKALLYGLFEGPPGDEELRQLLSEEANRLGPEALHHRLAAVDPTTAGRLHPNDIRRVIRALEVWQVTGQPISTWQTQWRQATAPCAEEVALPRCLWLDLPRAELYDRINRRVGHMIEAGLLEEARQLRQLPHPVSREASQAVGYQEAFAHLDGRISRPEAVALIQTRSRQLAKRQLTWFRQMPRCRPATPELTFHLWGLTMGS